MDTGIPRAVTATANILPPATTTNLTANAMVNAAALAQPRKATPAVATQAVAAAPATQTVQRRDIRNILTYAPSLSETRNNHGANVPTQNLDSLSATISV